MFFLKRIALLFCIFVHHRMRATLKRYLAYGFIFLYLLAMVRPVGPLFEYILFEDYIAEFLCINKDNVALECKGKCYLMQKLAQQNEDKKQNLPGIALEDYPIGFVHILFLKPRLKQYVKYEEEHSYLNNYSYLFSDFFFHPPSKIS